MKKARKILSIILALCMVLQILPVFAEETAEAVETTYTAQAQLLCGRTIGTDESFELQFINATDAAGGAVAIESIPTGAVMVDGATVTESFDPATGILTLTPETALTEGNIYTVNVDIALLANAGMEYTGTEQFFVRARGERSTGVSLYDTFDDGTDCGWVAGETTTGYGALIEPYEMETGEKVLKVSLPKAASSGNGKFPVVTKLINNGNALKTDSKVIIEARVMKAGNNGAYDFRINRPNETDNGIAEEGTASANALFKQEKADGGIKAIWYYQKLWGLNNVYGNWCDAQATSKIDTTGKWVEYEVVIDPSKSKNGSGGNYNNYKGYTLTATVDGEVVVDAQEGQLRTSSSSYEAEFGKGTNKKMFSGIDSVAFMGRGDATELYIDYVKVYSDEAPADIKVKKQIENGDPFEVAIYSKQDLAEVPEGIVTVEGLTTTQSYNANKETVSLSYEGELDKNTTYTVKVDKEKLAESGLYYDGETEFEVNVKGVFRLREDFDVDAGNWKIGNYNASAGLDISNHTFEDGTTAMKITKTKAGATGAVVNVLENPLYFKDGKTIKIKTRFMMEGNGAETPLAHTYFKINMPDVTASEQTINTTKGSEMGHDWYTSFNVRESGIWNMKTDSWSAYNSGNGDNIAKEQEIIGQWVDVELTFNGGQTYAIKATYEDGSIQESTGTLKFTNQFKTQTYIPYTYHMYSPYATKVSAFERFDTFTWYFRDYANTMYVDYFEVSEVVPQIETQAQLLCGSTIGVNDSFELQFINTVDTDGNESAVSSVPAGAVTIDGVETTQSFNAETQTLTITPDVALTEGNVYTVNIDTELLKNEGLEYLGTESFSVRARGERSTGVSLYDNFDDGTVQGWVAGDTLSSYVANVEPYEMETGEKVLKVTFPKAASSGNGKFPVVTKLINNGNALKTDSKVIIEARVMKTATNGSYDFRINRPDAVDNGIAEEGTASANVLFKQEKAESGIRPIWYYQNLWGLNNVYGNFQTATAASKVDTAGKWVDYKVVIDPSQSGNGKNGDYNNYKGYTLSAWVDGELVVDNQEGQIRTSTSSYETEFGAGTNKRMFNGIDSVTFMGRGEATDIYIDYVKVYSDEAPADIKVKKQIENGDPFEVAIYSKQDLAEVPEGIVTVEGLTTTQSYNAGKETVSLSYEGNLDNDATYTVKLDTEKLTQCGLYYDGETTFTVNVKNTFKIRDDFDSDYGNWKVANNNKTAGAVTLENYTFEDGTTALKVVKSKSGVTEGIVNILENPIYFKSGRTIKIKTRFMMEGNGDETPLAHTYFKINRPDVLAADQTIGTTKGSELGHDWYTVFNAKHDGIWNMKTDSWSASSVGDNIASEQATIGQWVDIEVVFNGGQTYNITAKYEDGTVQSSTGTLKHTNQFKDQMYIPYAYYFYSPYAPRMYNFERFDSFTWYFRDYANTLYIDYFEVEEFELEKVTAQILCGKQIEEGGVFELKFSSVGNMTEAQIADTVSVSGIEVTKTFDKETNILTLAPVENIKQGDVYTIDIDIFKMQNCDINYTGTTTFKVTGIKPRNSATGTYVNTDFEDGSLQGWKSGLANSGNAATVEPYTTNAGEKVLSVSIPKVANSPYGGGQGLAHYQLPEGIKFEKGNVVKITARVMNTTPGGIYSIKINRPDSLEQAGYIYRWNGYMIGVYDSELNFGTDEMHTYEATNQFKYSKPFTHDADKNEFSFDGIDLTNKWVDWEFVIDGTTNEMTVTASFDNNGEKVVLTSWADGVDKASALMPAHVREWIYGKGTDITTFHGLDSISFVSRDNTNTVNLYIDSVKVENVKNINKATAYLTVGGETAIKLNAGDEVVAKATVDSLMPGKNVLVSAIYVDGVLSDMAVEDIEILNGYETTFVSEKVYTVPETGRVEVKAFVWNTYDGMMPISAVASAKNEH